MSGDVLQLIESATDAGLTLIPAGDRLRVRGAEPMLADLLEELRRWKPAILTRSADVRPPCRPPVIVSLSCTAELATRATG